jgi:hypothetical protein
VVSVACIQITRALLGRGASCHERLVAVTNGESSVTSERGRARAERLHGTFIVT